MADTFGKLLIDCGSDLSRNQEGASLQILLELRRDNGANFGQGVSCGHSQAVITTLYYPTGS